MAARNVGRLIACAGRRRGAGFGALGYAVGWRCDGGIHRRSGQARIEGQSAIASGRVSPAPCIASRQSFDGKWFGGASGDVWLALEEVRDPGNLGTIIRTVDAVGAKGIILVGNCCDPWSRECVRATMGSIFAVPIARVERSEFLDWRQGWDGDVVATHLAASEDFRTAKYQAPILLMMGSEGPGLSDALNAVATRRIKIPMAGRLDSLNLAVATALVLYQMRGAQLKLD